MSKLLAPTGLLTFVFTDIVSSTRLWDDPKVMGPALRLHDEIVRDAFESGAGYVFSVTGDGFGVAFEHADAAIRASVNVQRRLESSKWPGEVPIRVRIGMHLGRAEEREGNYFGPPVNRSARVMAVAQGGQILVSATVREAAESWLSDDIALVPLGPVELKDVTEPIEIYTVSSHGVEVAVAPKAQVDDRPGNLPEFGEQLVGRAGIVSEVTGSLVRHRLVMLVGVGGVGKTTLAVEVGRRVANFPDGVWLVKLGEITDGRVGGAIAESLGLSVTGDSIDEIVDTTLRTRQLLLIFDNCEHILREVATAVERILTKAPNVRILATSRESLRMVGEQVHPIQPLGVEENGEYHSDAVELFLRRARECGASVDSVRDRQAITEICVRLDGLPLAIELAAAKSRAFEPSRLRGLLQHRFQVLGNERGHSDARHQTLRATFEWSYELLDVRDRSVFDAIGLFAGRFDLDDAAALCTDEHLSEVDVFMAIASLVDKSLLQRAAVSPPYRMLESLREFSIEKSVAREFRTDLARRHALVFRDLAVSLRARHVGPAAREVWERVGVSANDFESAVSWAYANGEIDLALAIVVELSAIGFQLSWRKAPTWLAPLLADPPDPLPALWADFLSASAATALNEFGAVEQASALAFQSLEIDGENPQALSVLAHAARAPGECFGYATRAYESGKARGEPDWELTGVLYQGFGSLADGRTREASEFALQLRRRGEQLGYRAMVGWGWYVNAMCLSGTDPARAHISLDDARSIADECSNSTLEMSSRRHRVAVLIAGDDVAAAEEAMLALIERSLDLGEIDQARRTCAFAGVTRALNGDDEVAAVLIGKFGLPKRAAEEHARYRAVQKALFARLGTGIDALLERGRSMSAMEALDFTRQSLRDAYLQR